MSAFQSMMGATPFQKWLFVAILMEAAVPLLCFLIAASWQSEKGRGTGLVSAALTGAWIIFVAILLTVTALQGGTPTTGRIMFVGAVLGAVTIPIALLTQVAWNATKGRAYGLASVTLMWVWFGVVTYVFMVYVDDMVAFGALGPIVVIMGIATDRIARGPGSKAPAAEVTPLPTRRSA